MYVDVLLKGRKSVQAVLYHLDNRLTSTLSLPSFLSLMFTYIRRSSFIICVTLFFRSVENLPRPDSRKSISRDSLKRQLSKQLSRQLSTKDMDDEEVAGSKLIQEETAEKGMVRYYHTPQNVLYFSIKRVARLFINSRHLSNVFPQ